MRRAGSGKSDIRCSPLLIKVDTDAGFFLWCSGCHAYKGFVKKKRSGICALCGNIRELTRDHTPPRCLFPKPQTSPIILNTCSECNNGTASQDEEFGVILNLVANDPIIENDIHWKRSNRTLKNQRQILRSLLVTRRPVLLQTESGIIHGKGAVMNWPIERLIPSVEKSVRLLHFRHLGCIVHDSCRLSTYSFDLTRQPVGREIEKRAFLLDVLTDCQHGTSTDPEFFHYRWGKVIDAPQCSVWILIYMKRIAFLTTISPDVDDLG